MKVLYINYLFDTKYSSVGAAVHVKEFTRAAQKAGLDIKACGVNKFSSEEAAVESKFRAGLKKRLSKYVGQMNAVLSNYGYFRRELQLVRKENPDALLVRYNLLNFSAPIIAKIKGIPLVLEVNSPMALENQKFNKKQVHLPFVPEWAEKLNLRLADKVFTVSSALRQYFVKKGIDGKKISVVPNGVDIERFSPDVDGCDIRTRHGLQDYIVLGFVGSFHYWHGMEAFEEFVDKLCAKYENVGFLFVGDGPLRAELADVFARKDFAKKVVLAGYVDHDEIPAYLAAMDIMLAPYPPMTFFYFSPLKLFEYMAAGKPVVASRVGQISEMIEHRTNGLLYEPGNMGELINCCSELIENKALRVQIGQNAREDMCQKHSWQVNAESVIGLISESMNGTHESRQNG